MEKYIMVLDTETAGTLDKPFCYDVGYLILDTKADCVIVDSKHFIVEQIWHNLPLFDGAYYAEKRQDYIQLMRRRVAVMDKFGYIMREMARDIKKYNITDAYAYNSPFDDKVIARACDWFKCINPLETVAIHDIWGYACSFITQNDESYKEFCEKYEQFTETGNYKQSAETVYRYITHNPQFEEMHMGLYDCEIEAEILKYCIDVGAIWSMDYPVVKVLPRKQLKDFIVKKNGEEILHTKYYKKIIRDNTFYLTE